MNRVSCTIVLLLGSCVGAVSAVDTGDLTTHTRVTRTLDSPPRFSATMHLVDVSPVASPVASRTDVLPEAESLPRLEGELPQLRTRTLGPASLTLHQVATYRIQIENRGKTAAELLTVRCQLPQWVELKQRVSQTGDVAFQSGTLIWSIPHIDARDQEELTLQLVPREGKAFDLKVDVDVRPSNLTKRIAVREPGLRVEMEGPGDINFEDRKTWHATVSNPGTGRVENVSLDLYSGTERVASTQLNMLEPGTHRKIDIRVIPRDTGKHQMRLVSSAGSIQDSATQPFSVHRGELRVTIVGALRGYAGQAATYKVSVHNEGDAAIPNVLVSLPLPNDVSYVGGIDQVDVTDQGLSWVLPKLAAGDVEQFALELVSSTGGAKELSATAVSMDRLSGGDTIVVTSLTAPDLRLVVRDPVGPRSLRNRLVYKIDVVNHGTGEAKGVSVVAIVADECEIIDVSGTAAIDGQNVYFKPKESLPAGHKLSFEVIARPKAAGTHDFRVVAQSSLPVVRLATQETTLVYEPSQPVAIQPQSDRDFVASRDFRSLFLAPSSAEMLNRDSSHKPVAPVQSALR